MLVCGWDGWRQRAGRAESGLLQRRDSHRSQPAVACAADESRSRRHSKKLQPLQQAVEQAEDRGQILDAKQIREFVNLRDQNGAFTKIAEDREQSRHQGDWAARVELNGKVSGVFTDYHYFGTGDIGGTPDEGSVKLLKAIVTKGVASLPLPEYRAFRNGPHPGEPSVKVGDGPVHVISANAEQMFLDITPAQVAGLPRYTGEMELTNHSAGSLTSQGYQKRWIRKEELLTDAAEKASLAALHQTGSRSLFLKRE